MDVFKKSLQEINLENTITNKSHSVCLDTEALG